MDRVFLPLLLLAALSACTTAPNDQTRLKAVIEALPELAPEIADRIDTVRMAVRSPELAALPVDTGMPVAAMAPCCSSFETKRLQVLYETTWCEDPFADVRVKDLALVIYRGTGDSSVVRDSKLSTLGGRKLKRPFWCHTSSGPWEAELMRYHGCTGGPTYTMSISTPSGLLVLPSWAGGEEYKPAEVTVLACTLVSVIETRCPGLSTCTCISSVCQQDCDCPLF